MRLPRPRRVVERSLDGDGPVGPADGTTHRGGITDAALASLEVIPEPSLDDPVLTASDVSDRRHVSFVADPFVVRADGRYCLFFEIKRRNRWPAFGLRATEPRFDIGHATSTNGRDWTYEGVVLPAEEAEHTYPRVFEHDGQWLMVPSPAGRTPNEFRVYRADPFPDAWALRHTALSGEVRIDPTPFEYRNGWYVVYQETDTYDVCLQYADDLFADEWHEHPASPLFSPGGNDIAPGGRPLVGEAGVDLFFRRGTPGIVEHWRVTDLSPDGLSMRERPTSPMVAGTGESGAWNGRNMHHVDAGLAVTDDTAPVAVDGQDADGDYRIGLYRIDPDR
jgi:hypothetical protein